MYVQFIHNVRGYLLTLKGPFIASLSLSLSLVNEKKKPCFFVYVNDFGSTVCFFVLCKRHEINRVPGAHQGDSLCIPSTVT